MGPKQIQAELTRNQLYEQVWTKPMRTLAKEYGLSDVGLAKICRKHNIPRPPVGYWQKLQFGKKVKKPPLPKSKDSTAETIRITGYIGEADNTPKVDYSEVQPQLDAELLPENAITVPDDLPITSRLIQHTRKSIRKSKPDNYNRVSPHDQGCLALYICPESIERATRLLQALLNAFEKRGYKMIASEEFPTRTIVRILGEEISFVVEEHATRIPNKDYDEKNRWFGPPEYFFISKGRLRMRIPDVPGNYGRGWTYEGTDKRPLELRLNDFMRDLIRLTVLIKRDRVAQEIRRQERELERKREEEAMRLQRIEEARTKQLEGQVADWHSSQRIRKYVEAVQADLIAKLGEIAPDSKAAKWIAWALRKADRLDPLRRGDPWAEPVEVRYW